jgi:hypothetical protein
MTLIKEAEQCGTRPEKLGLYQVSIPGEEIDFENEDLAGAVLVDQKQTSAGG